ncbi:sodium-coupled monocarboxylate transporter 1-like [Periplaneta americana]|uniref:sodium-coupled monocarboxylate transporter 1-like n=1 Tax=Periplaneta americana TaxID=6978 RepID=UPI0037E807E8
MSDTPNVSMEDNGEALHGFEIADYIVFVFMLLVCFCIGIYYGFCTGKVSATEYLMGGRNMQIFPVAMSLISSVISGITLLGTPTEIYLYGIQYAYTVGGIMSMGVAVSYAYLPVFHNLQLTSTYEYLERRFNKQVRLLGSFIFSIGVILLLPIVIYVPALAFNHVTGINVHIITPAVCLVCIFYTCMGGLKAVVWTDVVQTSVMLGAMVLVMVKGTIDVGGFRVVWEHGVNSGRIEPPDLSPDPTVRHSVLSLCVGGFFFWLQVSALNQNMTQRYLTLPTMRAARIALSLFIMGAMVFIFICSYCGLLIFARYHNCDPLTTKRVARKDQLLPLLVMDTLKDLPGLSGLFIAGVFSAALSTLSTSLNSMAAVILEDFYKSLFKHQLSPRKTNILLKTVVAVLGVTSVSLVFVVEKLGSVLELTLSLIGVSNGASLGIFSMGLFLPWINSEGAIIGGLAGLGIMGWLCVGTQAAIASGDITFLRKPVTVEGCTNTSVTPTTFIEVTNSTLNHQSNNVFVLYQMSYMWYTLLGAVISMFVALLVSLLTCPTDITTIDPMYLSPVIRRFLPKKKANENDVDMTLIKQTNVCLQDSTLRKKTSVL